MMNRYRFYFLDANGFAFKGEDYGAVDDVTALEAAIARSHDHPIEIWQAARCVAKLKKGGDAASHETLHLQHRGNVPDDAFLTANRHPSPA